jgi:hypothetical protein
MYDLIAAEMTGVQFDNANGITVGGKPYNQAITVDNTEAAKAQFEQQAAEMQKEAAKINEQISENQKILDDAETKTKIPKLLVIGVIALGVGMILFKK